MNSIFKIGVTGHRDLKQECLEYYEEQVHRLLIDLKRKYINLVIYSPLSDGADRLVVKEGLKLNIPFIVVLPMPKNKYIMDFNDNSLLEFTSLLNQAQDVIMTPLYGNNTLDEISSYSNQRDLQYEACGHNIVDSCNTLIALWDAKYTGLAGGTGEIVRYYLKKQYNNLYHLLVSRTPDIKDIRKEFNNSSDGIYFLKK